MIKTNKNIFGNLPTIIVALIFLAPLLSKGIGLIIFIIIMIILYLLFYKYKINISNKLKNKHMGEAIDLDKIKAGVNFKRLFVSIVIGILVLWLFFASIVVVDAGETGIYSLFGRVKDQELKSGFHLVIPLARVHKISIRTEEYTMSIANREGKKTGNDSISALTKEGLSVDLDITTLYRVNENDASQIYKTVGLNYEEKIIRPQIRSAIREVIAQYEAKDIYSEKRQEATKKIMDNLKSKLEPRGIILEDVLLRNVKLPSNLAKSIQEKLQAEQESEKYEFLLQKEAKEKQRKIIEAEGQRDAQKIINESLSQNYLYYSYIKELKDRAGTIYVPTNPSTGMPMFRNLGK